jgi:2-oxoglutarate ferredoxin oxidoreductase subunit alpha
MAIEAVNIARKYSVPVIILTDQGIATRIEAFPNRTWKKFARTFRPTSRPSPITSLTICPPPTASPAPRARHAHQQRQISHRHRPGTRRTRASDRLAKLHMQMTAKRRKKLQALGATLPVPKIYGPPEGNVLLVGWGSTEGPIKEAVDRARAAGDSVSSLHIRTSIRCRTGWKTFSPVSTTFSWSK